MGRIRTEEQTTTQSPSTTRQTTSTDMTYDAEGRIRSSRSVTQDQQVPAAARPSCEEICTQRGRSTQPPDHSRYIQSYLEQQRCISGARVKGASILRVNGEGLDCRCYSNEPPEIQVDQTPPQCPTPCGTIACGSSTSCPCPDSTANCVIQARCEWKGWKVQNGIPVPVVGSSATQQ
ncbi:hypothetical protein HY641_03525 [Candidatus Woesearchaeota archaeon]|nr:hypothetical protein [Candidatus Woesearchaeota archaeon]